MDDTFLSYNRTDPGRTADNRLCVKGKRNGQAAEPGWLEVACGVVAQLDSDGKMLTQRTFVCLQEPGKTSLKRSISQDVWHGMPQAAQGRELKLVAIADGTKDNWSCLESLARTSGSPIFNVVCHDAWGAGSWSGSRPPRAMI